MEPELETIANIRNSLSLPELKKKPLARHCLIDDELFVVYKENYWYYS